jgi:hypothetical protein
MEKVSLVAINPKRYKITDLNHFIEPKMQPSENEKKQDKE